LQQPSDYTISGVRSRAAVWDGDRSGPPRIRSAASKRPDSEKELGVEGVLAFLNPRTITLPEGVGVESLQ
jgi:hypothetical protein